MKIWPVQDAKARFSELLRASLTKGPQVVSLRGVETAVLVPMEEWRNMQNHARPSLKELLLTRDTQVELDIPKRGKMRRRVLTPVD